MEEVGNLVMVLREYLLSSIGRPVDYVSHYKENVDNLHHEVQRLASMRNDIELMIEQAQRNGEVIERRVEEWLRRARDISEEAEKILGLEFAENQRCLKGLCPNIYSRFRLSKEAERRRAAIAELENSGHFDRISYREPPSQMGFRFNADYVAFDSRKRVFEEILESLASDVVNAIGIYGMGGVGKTEMMAELGNRAIQDMLFDEVAMAVVSQNPDIRRIQGEIADCFNLKLDFESEFARSDRLFHRLSGRRKILIILDDIWGPLDLSSIGIPLENNGSGGCKVVIASRSRRVCHRMAVQRIFSVGVLSKQEAWDLFMKKVGKSVDTQGMRAVAEKVCEECGGLPVAILAIGAALSKTETKYAWDDALYQLRNSNPTKIEGVDLRAFSSLEQSYNFLRFEELQSCFLLCLLTPMDDDISIDCLVRYGIGTRLLKDIGTLEEARARVHTLVDALIDSSLLLKGEDEECVRMHNVIRGMATSIALDAKRVLLVKSGVKWPKRNAYVLFTAIHSRPMDVHELPSESECPKLQTLVLDCNNLSREIPEQFFTLMQNLQVLDLCDMLYMPVLPSSFQKLIDLRMLGLKRCKLTDISVMSNLNKLEILDLSGSDFETLPREVGQLTCMRLLNLKKCENLRIISPGVFSSLYQLEELYMPNSFDRWEDNENNNGRRNASLAELKSLLQLSTLEIHVPDVTLLPQELGFGRWSRFKISIGNHFNCGEEKLSSRILKLVDITLQDGVTVLLKRARVLYLCGLKGLLNVVQGINKEDFSELEYLEVNNCDGIEDLFIKLKGDLQSVSTALMSCHRELSWMHFCKLRVLKVSYCKMKYLFTLPTVEALQQLRHLEIRKCTAIEEIVEKERELGGVIEEAIDGVFCSQLEFLVLETLPNLRTFYLRTSLLEDQALFNEKVAFHNLTSILVNNCARLIYLLTLAVASGLIKLQKLEIQSCDMMFHIVSDDEQGLEEMAVRKIVLPQLSTLAIINLPNLVSFGTANCAFELPSLEEVLFVECPKLTNINLRSRNSSKGICVNGKVLRGDLNDQLLQQVKGKGLAANEENEEAKLKK